MELPTKRWIFLEKRRKDSSAQYTLIPNRYLHDAFSSIPLIKLFWVSSLSRSFLASLFLWQNASPSSSVSKFLFIIPIFIMPPKSATVRVYSFSPMLTAKKSFEKASTSSLMFLASKNAAISANDNLQFFPGRIGGYH